MTTQEVLLTIMTATLVLLALIVMAVLVAAFQAIRKFKTAIAEMQELAHKGSSIADAMAPVSAVTIGVMRVAKILFKKRK